MSSDDPSHDQAGLPTGDGPIVLGRRRSFISNVFALFGSQLVTWLLTFVVVVTVARELGPEPVGQQAIAGAFWMIGAVIAGWGTGTVITLDLAEDASDPGEVLRIALTTRLMLFVGVAGAVSLLVLVFGYDEDVIVLVALAGVVALFSVISEALGSALQGLEDMVSISRITVLTRIAESVTVVVAVTTGLADVRGVLAIGAVATAFNSVLLWRTTRSEISTRPIWRFDQQRRMLRRGLPYLLGFLAVAVYRQSDVIVMSALLDEDAVGWYAAADRIVGTTFFLPTILMAAFFPMLARAQSMSPEEAARLFGDAFRGLMLVSMPVGAGLILFGNDMAVLLLGDEYAGSGQVIVAMGVVTVLTFHGILLGNYAVIAGRAWFYAALVLVAGLATVPLDLVFVPIADSVWSNGAVGGALSYVVTELAIVAIGVAVVARFLASRQSAVRLVQTSIGCAVLALVALLLPGPWPVRALSSSVVYVLALLVLRTFDESEKARIRSLVVKLRERFGPRR